MITANTILGALKLIRKICHRMSHGTFLTVAHWKESKGNSWKYIVTRSHWKLEDDVMQCTISHERAHRNVGRHLCTLAMQVPTNEEACR